MFTPRTSQSAHASRSANDAFFKPRVQPKLAIGKPGDRYEVEADRTADKVVSGLKEPKPAEAPFLSPKLFVQPRPEENIARKQEESEQQGVQEKPLTETITPLVQTSLPDEPKTESGSEALQKKTEPEKTGGKEEEQTPVQEKPLAETISPVQTSLLEEPTTEAETVESPLQKKADSEIAVITGGEAALPGSEPKTAAPVFQPKPVIQQKQQEKTTGEEGSEQEEEIQEKSEEEPQRQAQLAGAEDEKPTEEAPQPVQAKCAECEQKEAVAKEKGEAPVQTKCEKCEEKQAVQTKSGHGSGDISSALKASKGGGSAMSGETQSQMSKGFGADFSNVRIHTDANAVQMNKSLGSQAFANGSDIYFNEGKYDPGSDSGKHLLAHELTHTVQQGASGGTVQKKEEAVPEGADYVAVVKSEKGKAGGAPAGSQPDAKEQNEETTGQIAENYNEGILQEETQAPELQMAVEDYGHPEDSSGPEQRMAEKRREEDIEGDPKTDLPPQSDSEEERPDKSEINEQKGELNEEAKPDANREAENAPKIEEKSKELDTKVEKGGEVKGDDKKKEGKPKKDAKKTPAEQAKAKAKSAFARSESFGPPERPKEVADPVFQSAVDSEGQELPVNPVHEIKTAALAIEIKVLREKAYDLKVGAVAEKAKAEEMRGAIETGKAGAHESNEVIDQFELHSQARRENVENVGMNVEESNRRVDWVMEEAPRLAGEAKDGSRETESMAEETKDQKQNVADIPKDEESSETNAETASQLENTGEGAAGADASMKQMGEVNDQLLQEAVDAKSRNQETTAQLSASMKNIETGEKKLRSDQELNNKALAKFGEMSTEPDIHMAKAENQEEQADQLIASSEEREQSLHDDLRDYYNALRQTPAEPKEEDYLIESDEDTVIQRAMFSGPEAAESGLTTVDAERLNEDQLARQEFLAGIEDTYQRRLAENELDMIRDFDTMTVDSKQWYAMTVAWNKLMGGVAANGFGGFLKDMLLVTFWPPATAGFMWHLMWPDTKNDPWWVAGLRYAAGWTSAAAVLFGSLWGISLAGFLIGSVLTLFLFTAPAGFPMVGIFGPLMQIFGALFEMAAYISAIFHLLALTYDIHQAGNAKTSEELSKTSDQVADDVQRGMVAYLGTAMMFMGPYISAVLGKTPLGKWWGRFKGWFEGRQNRIAQLRSTKVTPKNTGKPNPTGDSTAGEEFIGEGVRMNEQPFEGNTGKGGPKEGEINVEGEIKNPGEKSKTTETEVEVDLSAEWGALEAEIRAQLKGKIEAKLIDKIIERLKEGGAQGLALARRIKVGQFKNVEGYYDLIQKAASGGHIINAINQALSKAETAAANGVPFERMVFEHDLKTGRHDVDFGIKNPDGTVMYDTAYQFKSLDGKLTPKKIQDASVQLKDVDAVNKIVELECPFTEASELSAPNIIKEMKFQHGKNGITEFQFILKDGSRVSIKPDEL